MKKTSIISILFFLMFNSFSFAQENAMVRVRALGVSPDVSDNIGGNIAINNESVPEVDFSYFFHPNFAVELILATATHDVNLNGTGSLGSVSLLPPTLLAQYHMDFGILKPYVGAGINYTIFYGEVPGDMASTKYDDSFGYALQLGTDIKVAQNMYLNFDVKKLYLQTDATVDTGSGVVNAEVDIDPLLVGVGIGFRF
ncbi:OmpW/AlkL family protein [Halobacteriovorax sp. GFR7]|uniref:OmpW/AlkL family protein n=1 Tax=unclassified Halobacteriovorax TaxID=2639665 RepID=UPI003717B9C8